MLCDNFGQAGGTRPILRPPHHEAGDKKVSAAERYLMLRYPMGFWFASCQANTVATGTAQGHGKTSGS